jgi:hypothetical protein
MRALVAQQAPTRPCVLGERGRAVRRPAAGERRLHRARAHEQARGGVLARQVSHRRAQALGNVTVGLAVLTRGGRELRLRPQGERGRHRVRRVVQRGLQHVDGVARASAPHERAAQVHREAEALFGIGGIGERRSQVTHGGGVAGQGLRPSQLCQERATGLGGQGLVEGAPQERRRRGRRAALARARGGQAQRAQDPTGVLVVARSRGQQVLGDDVVGRMGGRQTPGGARVAAGAVGGGQLAVHGVADRGMREPRAVGRQDAGLA